VIGMKNAWIMDMSATTVAMNIFTMMQGRQDAREANSASRLRVSITAVNVM